MWIIGIPMQGTKSIFFLLVSSPLNWDFDVRIEIFLGKGEFQPRKKSKLISLFGVLSLWGYQNDLFQICFRSNFLIFNPLHGEENWCQKAEKFHVFAVIIIFDLTDSLTFFRISMKMGILFPIKEWNRMFCFRYIGKRIIFEKEKDPNYQKTVFIEKKTFFHVINRYECVNEYLDTCRCIGCYRVSSPLPSLLNCGPTPHLFYESPSRQWFSRDGFCASWALSGKGRNSYYWIE